MIMEYPKLNMWNTDDLKFVICSLGTKGKRFRNQKWNFKNSSNKDAMDY